MGQDLGSLFPQQQQSSTTEHPSLPATTNTTTTKINSSVVYPLQQQSTMETEEIQRLNSLQSTGKALQAQIELYGGQLAPNLHVGVTHVIIQPEISNTSRADEIQVTVTIVNVILRHFKFNCVVV
jgi:hypothetical protein